jgi:predicted RNA-binding protein with TRAM domain
MTKYRLKKEARQFFKKDLSENVKPIEFWVSKNIHENLLEETEKVYVEYGKWASDVSKSLKSHDGNNKLAALEFTVFITDCPSDVYNDIPVPKVMDEIQKVLNRYFKDL